MYLQILKLFKYFLFVSLLSTYHLVNVPVSSRHIVNCIVYGSSLCHQNAILDQHISKSTGENKNQDKYIFFIRHKILYLNNINKPHVH